MNRLTIPFALLIAATRICNLHAQPLVTIDTVMVGDAGNAADTRTNTGSFGYGAVTNVFAIGKYEVTISQYTTFLNSVASVTSSNYVVNLWHAAMTSDLNIAGISRSGAGTLASPYSYSVIGSGNRPVTYVSWFDAARFANWINNGATNGASTETGAYTLNGATNGVGFTVNPGATWSLPSENQWYKAAYYKGSGTNAGYWVYASQSDTAPGNVVGSATNQANYKVAGLYSVTQATNLSSSQNYLTDVGAFINSASAYDTFDQGGNVWEWNDAMDGGSSPGLRGEAWIDSDVSSSLRNVPPPWIDSPHVGFRMATVPEPSTYALLALTAAGLGALVLRRRRK